MEHDDRRWERSTTDHDEIRRWVEAQGGRPAVVREPGRRPRNRRATLTVLMPGADFDAALAEPIAWREWFRLFDRASQAFTYRVGADLAEPPVDRWRDELVREGRLFQRAVVTGGAGFVGSHVCEALLARGVDVLCLDDFSTGTERNLAHIASSRGFDCEPVDVRALDERRAANLFDDADLVVHLAAPSSPVDCLHRPLEVLEAGVVGTHHVLAAAGAVGARFVLGSASPHDRVPLFGGDIRRSDPTAARKRATYRSALRSAEAQVASWAAEAGLDATVVRLHNVYGPRMRTDEGRMIPTFVEQARRDGVISIPGDGRNVARMSFVSDVAAGVLEQASRGVAGAVVLGLGTEVPVHEVARDVRDALGDPIPIEHISPVPEVESVPDVEGGLVSATVRPAVGADTTTPWRTSLCATVASFS